MISLGFDVKQATAEWWGQEAEKSSKKARHLHR
jgi:hypothetical protein